MQDGNPKSASTPSVDTDAAPDLPAATVTVDSTGDALEVVGSNNNGAANEGEIEKLQELLFGNQLRAINQKIMLVHKDFKQSIGELERKLENQIQTETGTLKNIYESASVQMLSSSNDAHDKITILEQAQAGAQVNIEDRLKTLNEDIENKLQAISGSLQKQINDSVSAARQDESYRAALSDLLSGIADKVKAIDIQPPSEREPEHAASFTAPTTTEAVGAPVAAPAQEPHPLDSMLDDENDDDEEHIPTLTPSNKPAS